MKTCVDCGRNRPYDAFHRSGLKYRANCKDCRARKDREDKLRRHYNITPATYQALLLEQGGVCRICRQPETLVDNRTGVVMNLAVDHDHSCCPGIKTCGQCIRGLLCSFCNTALGLLGDDVNLLVRSILYLQGQLVEVSNC